MLNVLIGALQILSGNKQPSTSFNLSKDRGISKSHMQAFENK